MTILYIEPIDGIVETCLINHSQAGIFRSMIYFARVRLQRTFHAFQELVVVDPGIQGTFLSDRRGSDLARRLQFKHVFNLFVVGFFGLYECH